MLVLESAVSVARRSLWSSTTEDRQMVVRVTNGTQVSLHKAPRDPVTGVGACHLSFFCLSPGEAGTIRFTSSDSPLLQSMTSGCHHAGAVELLLGSERVFLAESNPFGSGRNKFAVDFMREGDKGSQDLEHFYWAMPPEFMGSPGARAVAKRKGFAAHVTARSPQEVDVVFADNEAGDLEALNSLEQLCFAEWCQEHWPDCLAHALFVADFSAVVNALGQAHLADKAFAQDLLIVTFVTSGLCEMSGDALSTSIQAWRKTREDLVLPEAGLIQYAVYAALHGVSEQLRAHVEAGALLLRAALCSCMNGTLTAVLACKEMGSWWHFGTETPCEHRARRRRTTTSEALGRKGAGNDAFMAEHLVGETFKVIEIDMTPEALEAGGPVIEGQDDEDSEEEPEPLPPPPASSSTAASRSIAPPRTSEASHTTMIGNGRFRRRAGEKTADLIKTLVRHCIQTCTDSSLRLAALYERLLHLPAVGASDQAALRHFRRWLPLAQRRFVTRECESLPEVRFESYSSEIFGNLDGGGEAEGYEKVLQSLGDAAVEYKTLATNSKSGEFFFISNDKRFLVKTISEPESTLLQRMLPSYQAHLREWPRSLIVRYAGVFHVEVPSLGVSQYFTVMQSVFDPAFEIHETYDLKGSLFQRAKKKGESIGKDEDWIHDGRRLLVPTELRRELCAIHEVDAALLLRFEVMDYSLLVGVHYCEGQVDHPPGWRESGIGVVAEDRSAVYFVGLIDFLVGYSLKKQTENLFRVAQGRGEDASCVSPEAYATRQVRFVRERVVKAEPPEEDCGTLGVLRVQVLNAQKLVAADWIGTSDPYVRVTLGLFSQQTHVVKMTCYPRWDCTLYLPVNEHHASQDLDLSVWDEDLNKAIRGSDDFLGRLRIPMAWVLTGPQDLPDKPLEEVSHGLLSTRLIFEPLED